jgi:hypothetical protein
MRQQAGVIEGTAKQIRAKLNQVPDDEIVKLMLGRPSLSIIARKLQAEALARGMTDNVHDELINSVKYEQ